MFNFRRKPVDHSSPPTGTDDVAIIGLALRLPQSNTLDQFWQNLVTQRSSITEVSAERWKPDAYYGDPRKQEGKTNSIWGGFVEQADCFDAEFFKISPREAQNMDPQQRFALELSWHAMEDAGYRPSQLAGSNTGVYMGVCHWDYAELFEKSGQTVDAYFPTGTAYSIIANRVSHFFDLAGPSIINDTACASSLVSVYQAVRAIQNGEIDCALAGGVNLAWSVNHFIAFSKNGMLSKEGKSKAFDASADGYVRGEGGAVLLLKPLQKALADGDSIHAVIKGIGTNHGGHTSSLTVTNPKAQARLISQIYGKASIAPSSVSYIEAHGPGTPLGDPVEILGLKQAFQTLHQQFGTQIEPGSCGIGSVKTNIGHLEGAAGVAGMVKVVAAMQQRTLPANVHFKRLNPMIRLEGSPFYVVAQNTPWNPDGPRRAGVSSFGFGGTNAHVVIEEFVAKPYVGAAGAHLVPLSARDPQRLSEMVEALFVALTAKPETDLEALAYTLQTGREAMAERVVLLAHDLPDLLAKLGAMAGGKTEIASSWRGNQEQSAKFVNMLAADDGYQAMAARWVENRQLDKIAGFWAQGAVIDWVLLYKGSVRPPRLRLPTYPFARVRHWFPETGVTTGAVRVNTLHPLLHRNVSTLKQQAYSASFSGSEFFLADHLVAGQSILPGVVYLEMARAGLALALDASEPCVLKNIVWTRPLAIGASPAQVMLHLTPKAGGEIAYVLASGDQVHSQGLAQRDDGAPLPRLEKDVLRADCPNQIAPADCYERLVAAGMVHGPRLQCLQSLWVGERQLLAELRLPAALASSATDYLLHPALLDAAIQASVALLRGARPALPFALRELRFSAPCGTPMWAYLRQTDASDTMPVFDVDLCDEQGQVCVRMSGLALRALEAPVKAPVELPIATLTYSRRVWQDMARSEASAGAPRSLCVFVAAPGQQRIDALKEKLGAHVQALPTGDEQLQEATLLMLRHLQRLLGAQSKARVMLLVPDTVEGAPLLALAALIKTAKLESSRIDGKLIRVAGLEALDADALTELINSESTDTEQEVYFDQRGQRHVRRTQELTPSLPLAPVFRAGGVYWIIGGRGGIGLLLARHLATITGVKLVLTGRAEAPPPDIAADCIYLKADIQEPTEVDSAVASIVRKYGRIDGIFHCAGVLEDAFLINKTAQQLGAVFAPKVDGTRFVDNATRDMKLDFMVLFSSVAALDGGAGQGDYSVANAYLDVFAERRQAQVSAGQRHGTTIAINWPLWADGGMSMDAANIEAMRRRSGMVPLPGPVGLAALEILVGSGLSGQVGLLYRQVEAPSPIAQTPQLAVPQPTSDIEAETIALLKRTLGKVLQLNPQQIRSKTKFDQYGFDSIMAVEMTLQLEELLGSLPKTLFFEYVDLHGVAGYLLQEHRAALVARLGGQAPAVPPQPARYIQPAPPSRALSTDDGGHDVAVIGLAGRYPQADTMEQFWELLSQGRHSFEKIPTERWRHADIYHDERDILGKSTIKNGSFLADIDKFDPRYFNISQRDAELMSPEVRLFLQVGVEAFEDAGYSRAQMHKQFDGDVGVLVGTMSNHYNLLGFQNNLLRGARASGSYTGTLPNMLSYFYGFSGPSLFIDTMCSASATCIDQGVHMLRSKQCKMVLAGGVNLLLHPYNLISSSQEHFTSKTAELIRSYGQGADGTILGEGIGAVLLKPLADAIRDKDHIYGVIKGTAINNAGVRNGFTVPSPMMQAQVVQKALADANIDPRTISYLEGHGSGTKLGDPIEIQALTQAYRTHTEVRQFCPIGSVKSNIAHLLAAAGVAGFSKVLLQLKHRKIVPSLHSEVLNPDIPFADTPFFVQQELSDWQRPVLDGQVHPRRAGITSIGAGGMNSHIIVEEYDAPPQPLLAAPRLVVLSAMSKSMLLAYAGLLHDWLERHPETDLASLSYTLQVGRNALPCRCAFAVPDSATLLQVLSNLAAGQVAGLSYTENVVSDGQEVDDAAVGRALEGNDLARLADYWVLGAEPDWGRLWVANQPTRMSLPSCPFEKVRCWYQLDADAPGLESPLVSRNKLHPFIGRNLSDLAAVRYETEFRIEDVLDYVFHVGARPQILPGFPLDVAIALGRIAGFGEPFAVRNLRWHGRADWGAVKLLQTTIGASADGCTAQIAWQGADNTPQLLAEWQLARADASPLATPLAAVAASVDGVNFYRLLGEGGLDYRPYLKGVLQLDELADGGLLVTLAEPELRQHHYPNSVSLAPRVLGALQQVGQYLAHRAAKADWPSYALLSVEQMTLAQGPIAQLRVFGLEGSIELIDAGGALCGCLQGARFGVTDLLTHETEVRAPRMEELQTRIRVRMSEILKFNLDQIDTKTPFYSFGFDSISLAELAGGISAELGINLTPDLFFELENVDQLAQHIVGTSGLLSLRAPALASASPGNAPRALPRALPRVQPSPTFRDDQSVAIIGAAGRFPGADNLDQFWDNLLRGVDAVGPLDLTRYGKVYREQMRNADFPQRAGLLKDIARFDAGFFNVSPAEAELMDPQQRLLLETVWSALENSGYRPSTLPSATGVYVGVSATDYATLLSAHGVPTDAYTATGNSHAMLANRISFFLDVHGPSQAIDTACSSSLVALHRALESVRTGQCPMAIAGGVNITLTSDGFVGPQRAGMLSPNGLCQTFSAGANGYVRGEGVAALVLKSLREAERDGDTILGVLIGSAENHGGRANSLTAPNPRAQADLVETAMRGIDPASISYIETHGTGTSLGDPVEINGLKLAYGRHQRDAAHQCGLGSVKSNIGHLEAAAGIAGVVKVLLAMRHRTLPASLHSTPRNPLIELTGTPFHIVDSIRSWDAPAPLRAGVSSFGFGGANAHVLLEEYTPRPTNGPLNPGPWWVVLSARSNERLRVMARNLLNYIEATDGEPDQLERVAYTLQVGRESMQERLAMQATSSHELAGQLRAFLNGHHGADVRVLRGSVRRASSEKALSAQDDPATTLREWIGGRDIAWETLYRYQPRRIALPSYPFAPEVYWIPQHTPHLDLERMLDEVIDDVVSLDEAVDVLQRSGYGKLES